MNRDIIWVEKYRPKTVQESILPQALKDTFQGFVDKKHIPNLLLTGRPGVGKTTIARAMLDELNCDYIEINGSMDRNIDTLRTDIKRYASAVSIMNAGRKYVILDEADYLNPNSTQPALRNFMEEFSKNCGFILTCNFKNKIIAPLHSRCSLVEFAIPKNESVKLAGQFHKRVLEILDKEGIEYEPQVIVAVIKKFFPDWRRILNELQRYSATGKIDTGILTSFEEATIKTLMVHMKQKNFTAIRKWVAENADRDTTELYRTLYDVIGEYVHSYSVPLVILLLAKYQYQDSFAADTSINLCACLIEIMKDVEFK